MYLLVHYGQLSKGAEGSRIGSKFKRNSKSFVGGIKF